MTDDDPAAAERLRRLEFFLDLAAVNLTEAQVWTEALAERDALVRNPVKQARAILGRLRVMTGGLLGLAERGPETDVARLQRALSYQHGVLTALYAAEHDGVALSPAMKQAILGAMAEAAPLLMQDEEPWTPPGDLPALWRMRLHNPHRWQVWRELVYQQHCLWCHEASADGDDGRSVAAALYDEAEVAWTHRRSDGSSLTCVATPLRAAWEHSFRPETGRAP